MRPSRDIATVAGAQVVCFSLLTHLEPTLFRIHMYLSRFPTCSSKDTGKSRLGVDFFRRAATCNLRPAR